MDRYAAKRRMLRPLMWWRRRQANRLGPINEAVWEALAYSPAMRRFYVRAREEPDLLVAADLPSCAVVLDVGAFEGTWSSRLLARVDTDGTEQVRIHAFEPEPEAIRRLEARFDGDPRVVVHPFGLGARDEQVRLSIDGPGSSVYAGAGPSTEVALRDVDAVLRALGIADVHLLKINIEGGEYELLERLHQTGWLERTGPIIVQFHEFVPGAHRRRRASRRHLGATHTCTWRYGWVYERWDPRLGAGERAVGTLRAEGAT